MADKFTGTNKMVTVEPKTVVETQVEGEYRLVPYEERRGKWGATVAIGYSSYEPVNYEPNFVAAEFGDIYTVPDLPMVELQITAKRNLSFGSLGGEIAVGFYQNDSDKPALILSDMQVIPVRLGGIFFMDLLTKDNMVVPYGMGGAYVMIYEESVSGSSLNGNTQVAPYFGGGLAFQLDWIDKNAARVSYEDSGIQHTYAYAEAKSFVNTGDELDPNFGNDFTWGAGFRVEF